MIYIPEKIVVGFQNRTDTFDGKLSYIIYYDEKGVLRKEKSWQSWRDKNIDSVELKNEPFKAPYLNKGIQRTGYSFSSGRSMLRVYDPRGFEYEITIPNFIGITQYCDLIKGEFEGEFVYAFEGTDLILLPVDSEQYKKAKIQTATKNTKVSAKDLVPGQVYRANNGNTCIYIGKYNLNTNLRKYYSLYYKASGIKPIFYVAEEASFQKKSLSSLGEVVNTLTQEELNKYLDMFVGSRFEKKVKGFFVEPIDKTNEEISKDLLNYEECSYSNKFHQYYNIIMKNLVLGYEDKEQKDTYNLLKFSFPSILVASGKVTINLNELSIHRERFSIDEVYIYSDYKFIDEIFKDKKSISYKHYEQCRSVYDRRTFNTIEEGIDYIRAIMNDAVCQFVNNGVGILNVRFEDGSTEVLSSEGQEFVIE